MFVREAKPEKVVNLPLLIIEKSPSMRVSASKPETVIKLRFPEEKEDGDLPIWIVPPTLSMLRKARNRFYPIVILDGKVSANAIQRRKNVI